MFKRRRRIEAAPQLDQDNPYLKKVLAAIYRGYHHEDAPDVVYVSTESSVRNFAPLESFEGRLRVVPDEILQPLYEDMTKELGIPVSGASIIYELAAQLELQEKEQ